MPSKASSSSVSHPPLDGGDDIEALLSKCSGDRGRVVGDRGPTSRQRALLAFPAGPLVSLDALGHRRTLIDLVCELRAVVHRCPDEPRDAAEVGSRVFDVAATCPPGGHDLMDVEPSAGDEPLAPQARP